MIQTVKEEAVAAISKLPDTSQLEDIFEELVRHFEQGKDSYYESRQSKQISCLELAEPYIGCLDGPEDLSTNKTYFNDFGS